jgi:hypothetical protein
VQLAPQQSLAAYTWIIFAINLLFIISIFIALFYPSIRRALNNKKCCKVFLKNDQRLSDSEEETKFEALIEENDDYKVYDEIGVDYKDIKYGQLSIQENFINIEDIGNESNLQSKSIKLESKLKREQSLRRRMLLEKDEELKQKDEEKERVKKEKEKEIEYLKKEIEKLKQL